MNWSGRGRRLTSAWSSSWTSISSRLRPDWWPGSAMDVHVFIVRHGETDCNKAQQLQGALDEPLNALGRWQAERAGRHLRQEPFDDAYSSDLQRALHTAEAIVRQNEHFSDVGRIKQWPRLRERSFGVMEGRPWTEMVEEAKKRNLPRWDFTPEGAESPKQVTERAKLLFEELCADLLTQWPSDEQPRTTRSVLVASHGGFIKSLVSHLSQNHCSMPSAPAPPLCPNTGVTKLRLRFDEQKQLKMKSCLSLYDAVHLQEAPEEASATKE